METENTLFLRIESYLDSQMGEAERLAFEQEMHTNLGLSQEVQLQRDTRALLQLHSQHSYKQMLTDYDVELTEAEVPTTKEKIVQPLWRQTWFRAAAGFAFLLIAAYGLLYMQFNNRSIGRDAFSPYKNAMTVRHSDAQINALLKKGLEAYGAGQYEQAIHSFSQLPQDSSQVLARLYLGISYLATDQPEAASIELQAVKELSSPIQENARWYLILAQLQLNEQESAMKGLDMLIAEGSPMYQERAKVLQQKLTHPIKSALGIR